MKTKKPRAVAKLINQTEDKIFTAQKTADGYQNFLERVGVGNCADNSISQGHYEFDLITRNRIQLEAAYRGSWTVGKVIDTIAEDMTRAGIHITTNKDAETVPKIRAKMSKLQIWSSLCDAIKWGRLYGGAIAMMQIDGQDLASPLKLDTIGKGQFKGLAVYDRWQIWPDLTQLINSGPNMGLPAYYNIVLGTNLNDPGMEPGGTRTDEASGRIRVHHSRCIRFGGHKLPFFQAITEMMWDESVCERLWDRLIAFDDATMNVVGLMSRANLRTIQVDRLREILAAGGAEQAALVQQFSMMREMQNNEGVTLIDKEDLFAAYPYSFAGIPDTLLQVGQQLSGGTDIPLVRFFGQSPAGLNATGEADLRLYYGGINAKQEAHMRNPMEDLLKVMWRSETGRAAPKDMEFTFVGLWQMTAVDKATVAKTNTDTVIEAHEGGLISQATAMKELKQQSPESGVFTNITEEDIEEASEEPAPMPEEEESNSENNEEKGKEELTPKTGGTGDPGAGPAKPKAKAGDSAWKKIKQWLARDAGNFKESDHPRSPNGEFGSGGGGSGNGGKGEKPEERKVNTEAERLREEAEKHDDKGEYHEREVAYEKARQLEGETHEKPKGKKELKEMTQGEISKAHAALSKKHSRLVDKLMDAGYGHVKPDEMRAKRKQNSLFDEYCTLLDKMADINQEVVARYGVGIKVSTMPKGRK